MGWQDDPVEKGGWQSDPVARPKVSRRETARRKMAGSGVTERLVNNFAFGLGDEVSGLASAGSNFLVGGTADVLRAAGVPVSDKVARFAPVEAFSRGRAEYNSDMERAKRENPAGSTVADVTGLAGSIMAPMSYAQRITSLSGAVRAGATQGAVSGALSGAGNADGGLPNRAAAAGIGAATGATLGAVIPVSVQGVRNVVTGARRLTGRGPSVAPQVVAEALRADGGARRAAAIVNEGQARGVPLALGDTGDNARAILASTGRQPGPARTITRDAVIARQEGQTDRVAGVIARDLGPVANPRAVSEALQAQAKAAAAPLYDAAYAAPTPITDGLAAVLKRIPASAVENAKRVAKLEGRDPNGLGVNFNAAGDIELVGKPTVETLDFIKRGLDDVVEKYRDKTTGRLQLDGEGRAVNNLLREFTNEIDRVNPDYAAARAAYAGPVRAAAALNKGSSFGNKTADDIVAETRDLTPFELDQYRLGVRSAMTRALEAKGDYADKVRALVGTPKKRAALAQIFGGQGDFDRFMRTLADEARTSQTYSRVTGNSLTAENQAFDGATGDQGLVEIAANAATTGVQGRPVRALVQALADLRNYGAGEAGKRTRAEVAAALSETDPAILREALRNARRASAGQRVATQAAGRGAVRQGQGAGIIAGDYVNRLMAPSDQ